MNRRVTPGRSALRVLWNIVRAPILAALLLCEPIVQFICAAAMVLGVFGAIILQVSAIGAHFPLVGMLAFTVGFGVALILYYGLIALLLE
jgi:hypothetical protein